MSGTNLAMFAVSVVCIVAAGYLAFKKERGGAVIFGVMCVAALILAIGMGLVDQSRDAESSRVTTEIEARYKNIHVVELSAWRKTVRYTRNSERSKVCDGELTRYNGDWLILQDPYDCAVLPS